MLPEWGSLEVLYDTADGQKALTPTRKLFSNGFRNEIQMLIVIYNDSVLELDRRNDAELNLYMRIGTE